jgi:hypothetical protein
MWCILELKITIHKFIWRINQDVLKEKYQYKKEGIRLANQPPHGQSENQETDHFKYVKNLKRLRISDRKARTGLLSPLSSERFTSDWTEDAI